MTAYRTDGNFAHEMDSSDPLASVRNLFHFPKTKEGKEVIYLCGNSLGLQPIAVEEAVRQELEDWKNMGVEGCFTRPRLPFDQRIGRVKSMIADL